MYETLVVLAAFVFLASIVFTIIVLNEHLPGGTTIALTVVCTIILRIPGHGLSTHPLIKALVKTK